MSTIFLICAIVGGTVLVCQFVLTLIGLGGDGFDLDVDVPDDVTADVGDADIPDDHHVNSSWLFGIISFRTVVAALTFFGLVGKAVESGVESVPLQILLASAAGGAAMLGVHYLFQLFTKLGHNPTMRIRNAVGRTGTVYVPIAGNKEAAGKIQLKVQERLIEFPAMTTASEKLPTGARVRVVGLLSQGTLEVEPLVEKPEKPEKVEA